MSTFQDIATGYRRLANQNYTYGLIYTCNAGWLDLGHMNPYNSDTRIGAANLWNSVRAEGPSAQIRWGYWYPPGFRNYNYPQNVLDQMHQDRWARFPDGGKGYKVTFRMDQPVTWGTTRSYLVRHNLTEEQKKSVALTIFIDVSIRFEDHQLFFENRVSDQLSRWIRGKSYDSGYSEEDLVSNLIGFYVGVGEMTAAEAIALCHPTSQRTAEHMWNTYGAVGSNKNRTFSPPTGRSTTFDDNFDQMCRNDCIGQPGTLPSEFKTIQPARAGRNVILLRN